MRRIQILTAVLAALFALSAVVAVAAEATEAPFYKVEGARLASGETRAIIAKAGTGGFTVSVTGKAVKCSTMKLASGGVVLGSGVGEPGTGSYIEEFSNCAVEGNGTGCKVAEPIKTELLRGEFVVLLPKFILVEIRPASGVTIANLTFPTESCSVKATKVTVAEGSGIIGEARVAGKVVEEGKETEAKIGEVNFPTTAIKKISLIREGKVTEVEESPLKAFGVTATFSGVAENELTGVSKWGVFLK